MAVSPMRTTGDRSFVVDAVKNSSMPAGPDHIFKAETPLLHAVPQSTRDLQGVQPSDAAQNASVQRVRAYHPVYDGEDVGRPAFSHHPDGLTNRASSAPASKASSLASTDAKRLVDFMSHRAQR